MDALFQESRLEPPFDPTRQLAVVFKKMQRSTLRQIKETQDIRRILADGKDELIATLLKNIALFELSESVSRFNGHF